MSTRSYDRTASRLYRARFNQGNVGKIELVPGVSLAKPGIVNFDAEISTDGNTLYFVESQFGWFGRPRSAHILLAHRSEGGRFIRNPRSGELMKQINTVGLNYALSLTASELELFFTRVDTHGPAIYEANRASTQQAFDTPVRIEAVTGFAEAPTISPDENSLYFHKKEGQHFVLDRVMRRPR